MEAKTLFFAKFRNIAWNIDHYNMYPKSLSMFCEEANLSFFRAPCT